MPDKERDQKTEEATPRRREELRQQGQVAKSQDLSSAMILLLGVLVLYLAGPAMTSEFKSMFATCYTEFFHSAITVDTTIAIMNEIGISTLRAIAPLFAGVFVVAAFASYGQVGFVISGEALQFKFERMNPIKGMGRLFSVKSLAKLATTLLKVAVVGGVGYIYVSRRMADMPALIEYTVPMIFQSICLWSFELVVLIALVFFVIAAFDYAFQRWDFERDIRMTKEEMKEEFKRSEGDPMVKGRVRQIQREIASKRMMQDVPTADVIIRNPTHYAVAIRYQAGRTLAPVVVAKGMNLIAEKILETARKHKVPEVENKPLAQTLYKTVEIGSEVPPTLYKAVAEVLAYVYRLRNKARA